MYPRAAPVESSLGLLAYTRNDVDGVLRTVHALRPVLAQVVVVDSSLPEQRARLLAQLDAPRESIYVVPPLGYSDLFRPLGTSRMVTDRVLQLDSDETLSPALARILPGLVDADAYVVPRWETGVRGFTYHMRLFRREAVRYQGPCHGFPRVFGSTRTLPKDLHIIHESPGPRDYWHTGDRARRYMISNFLERPYDWNYLFGLLGLGSFQASSVDSNRGRDRPSGSLSPVSGLLVAIEILKTLAVHRSTGLAQQVWEQARVRATAWSQLTATQRSWLKDTAVAVRHNGGLVGYLGLAEESYIDFLNREFDSASDAPRLLAFLLRVRAVCGEVWRGEPSPPDLSVPSDQWFPA